tara:strand:+ start:1791 stop:2888 length:1098 start_codon:yes stop_codon:yes gene_type:complete
MANLFTRLLGIPDSEETRAVSPSILPLPRTDTAVSAEKALSLTAVYRATQILATPISKMDIKSFRFVDGRNVEILNPVIVNKPNVYESRRDFLFKTVSSLALTGEAFWYKTYGSNGQVNNLEILESKAVSISTDNQGKLYYGISLKDGKTKVIPANEIEHIKLFSLPGYDRGLGPIQMCKDDISGILDLRAYASTWFSSAGIPTGVLSTNTMLTSEQADDITSRWHEKQNKKQIAVLGNGFQYNPVALSPKEALFTEVQDQAVQTISRLFGIPPRLLITGVAGNSDTYTNLSEEQQTFYRHTLMAYLDAIEDAMSNCLPRGTSINFDYEGLFKADIAARYNYYKIAVDGGWMSPEEVRSKEGLDG